MIWNEKTAFSFISTQRAMKGVNRVGDTAQLVHPSVSFKMQQASADDSPNHSLSLKAM